MLAAIVSPGLACSLCCTPALSVTIAYKRWLLLHDNIGLQVHFPYRNHYHYHYHYLMATIFISNPKLGDTAQGVHRTSISRGTCPVYSTLYSTHIVYDAGWKAHRWVRGTAPGPDKLSDLGTKFNRSCSKKNGDSRYDTRRYFCLKPTTPPWVRQCWRQWMVETEQPTVVSWGRG